MQPEREKRADESQKNKKEISEKTSEQNSAETNRKVSKTLKKNNNIWMVLPNSETKGSRLEFISRSWFGYSAIVLNLGTDATGFLHTRIWGYFFFHFYHKSSDIVTLSPFPNLVQSIKCTTDALN